MEAMENDRSAHVFYLKFLKEFYLVFGIYWKIHSFQEISIGEGKYHKKQFHLFYLVFNSYASALIKRQPLPKWENDFCWFILLGLVEGESWLNIYVSRLWHLLRYMFVDELL